VFGQSPPTTSGIVIVSGSNSFDPVTSDWGTVVATLTEFTEGSAVRTSDIPFIMNDLSLYTPASGILLTNFNEVIFEVTAGFVPSFEDDTEIISTPVTTSGIVIMNFYPGAGAGEIPYVPPTYINQRLFPVVFSGAGERVFPEKNRRVYPVLPQFSVITPGD
jgi:hypothetical protein